MSVKAPVERAWNRRRFLRFLAGSPLLPHLSLPPQEAEELIASPAEAINVFDFEPVAKRNLPPAHWGYLATGVDDDATLRANREGFSKFQIRARHLVDVRRVDTSIEIFGKKWETPIVLAPAGSQRAFHEEGELAVARAAKAKGHLQILSTVTTAAVEEVNAARGEPVWYQLYASSDWRVGEKLVKRVEAAGCPVLVLTVDLPVGDNRETVKRFQKKDPRECSVCHEEGVQGTVRRKPMYEGIDLTGVKDLTALWLTWDFVRRLRDNTRMKLVLKGIVTREDAELSVQYGVDGIIVSNHGGRSEESGRSTIECLPEVVDAVGGKIPVLIDSGFRRGTDIFKALALGARAVCIGRPYLWGLAAFGQAGVERVLDILRAELVMVMQTAGVASVSQISRDFVREASR
jgi:4-hydroxymandelate oxidase